MRLHSQFWPQLAICLYAVWTCRFVLIGTYAPHDPYGAYATWIWLAAVPFMWQRIGQGSVLMSVLAGLCLLFGTIGDLNTAKYIGMALAIVALFPLDGLRYFYLCCAVSWIPSFVLFLNWGGLAPSVTPIRLSIAVLPLLLMVSLKRRRALA